MTNDLPPRTHPPTALRLAHDEFGDGPSGQLSTDTTDEDRIVDATGRRQPARSSLCVEAATS